MPEDALKLIHELLQKNEPQLSSNDAPINHAWLIDEISKEELREELNFFRHALKSIQTLEEFQRFLLERCKQRTLNNHQSLGFQALINTPCNHLYFQLVMLAFSPTNMRELLKALLPQLNQRVMISIEPPLYFTDTPHLDTQEQRREKLIAQKTQGIQLHNENLDALIEEKPSFPRLCEFVFNQGLLFDSRQILHYPLELQAAIKEAIDKEYPLISSHLYKHNPSFELLAKDIKLLNGALTPRKAISTLLNHLKLSGQRIHGGDYATDLADKSLEAFMEYLAFLPDELRDALYALKAGAEEMSKSLYKIIKEDLERDKNCVETAADDLNDILENRHNATLLNTSPHISKEKLLQLKKKYHYNSKIQEEGILYSEQKISYLPFLPETLAIQALRRLPAQPTEEFILLLIDFPASTFSLLLKHIVLQDPEETLKVLNHFAIDMVELQEQKEALAQALLDYSSSCELDFMTNAAEVMAIKELPLRARYILTPDGFYYQDLITAPKPLELMNLEAFNQFRNKFSQTSNSLCLSEHELNELKLFSPMIHSEDSFYLGQEKGTELIAMHTLETKNFSHLFFIMDKYLNYKPSTPSIELEAYSYLMAYSYHLMTTDGDIESYLVYERIEAILEKIPPEQRIEAVLKKYSFLSAQNLLYTTASEHDLALSTILENLSDQDKTKIVQFDSYASTPLIKAAMKMADDDDYILDAITEHFSFKQKQELITHTNFFSSPFPLIEANINRVSNLPLQNSLVFEKKAFEAEVFDEEVLDDDPLSQTPPPIFILNLEHKTLEYQFMLRGNTLSIPLETSPQTIEWLAEQFPEKSFSFSLNDKYSALLTKIFGEDNLYKLLPMANLVKDPWLNLLKIFSKEDRLDWLQTKNSHGMSPLQLYCNLTNYSSFDEMGLLCFTTEEQLRTLPKSEKVTYILTENAFYYFHPRYKKPLKLLDATEDLKKLLKYPRATNTLLHRTQWREMIEAHPELEDFFVADPYLHVVNNLQELMIELEPDELEKFLLLPLMPYNDKDKTHISVLSFFLQNSWKDEGNASDTIERLHILMRPNAWLRTLMKIDGQGYSPLAEASTNPKTFEFLLSLVAEKNHEALKKHCKIYNPQTLTLLIEENQIQIMETIIKTYSPIALLELLLPRNPASPPLLLHIAIHAPWFLAKVLDQFPPFFMQTRGLERLIAYFPKITNWSTFLQNHAHFKTMLLFLIFSQRVNTSSIIFQVWERPRNQLYLKNYIGVQGFLYILYFLDGRQERINFLSLITQNIGQLEKRALFKLFFDLSISLDLGMQKIIFPLLHQANPELFHTFLRKNGYLILKHFLARSAYENLALLLEFLPEQERFTAITTPSSQSSSIVNTAREDEFFQHVLPKISLEHHEYLKAARIKLQPNDIASPNLSGQKHKATEELKSPERPKRPRITGSTPPSPLSRRSVFAQPSSPQTKNNHSIAREENLPSPRSHL